MDGGKYGFGYPMQQQMQQVVLCLSCVEDECDDGRGRGTFGRDKEWVHWGWGRGREGNII